MRSERMPQPLARRILLSFILLTSLVAGINAWAIITVLHEVEEDLVGEELRQDMAAVENVFLTEGRIPDLTGGSALYAPTLRPQKPLPRELETPHPGYQEVVTERVAWHVLEEEIDGHRFILVRNQDAFEAREKLFYKVVAGGVLLAIALAYLIGRLTVRRVIDPVIRLAAAVRTQGAARPLATAYGDDELGQLAQAFDQAFNELQAALERERLFTSDVSHELRTPLMIVSTSCELLAQGPLPDNSQRQIARIAKAGADMQALVETFLQLARVQTTRLAEGDGVSLEQIAAEQVAVWQPLIEVRGLSFVYRQEGTVSGRWHPTLLRVVLGNLLRNALHYTEQGEIRLCLDVDGFRVEDTGPGIAPEELGRIFEPFQRGRHARGEGLGLGLSLVRRVCAQAGWSVTAEALAAGGSCFRVRLRP
ncbi:sensor histidine kinase [Azonexus hydrophilus]|uniref:sensor histidine kinase n=1 Tax=Azonexus hydrophilus TaxID=418702 RepID=UPI001965343D|nr:HAMP domain-containing sensor histidine kinase [Azonexus hydrophilus]